jgi:hypothetical protein
MNNDGAAHRKSGIHAGASFYWFLLRNNFPENYQILCWNCNHAKYINKGTCPHKETTQWQMKEYVPPIIDSTSLRLLESNLREQSTYLRYASTAAWRSKILSGYQIMGLPSEC